MLNAEIMKVIAFNFSKTESVHKYDLPTSINFSFIMSRKFSI